MLTGPSRSDCRRESFVYHPPPAPTIVPLGYPANQWVGTAAMAKADILPLHPRPTTILMAKKLKATPIQRTPANPTCTSPSSPPEIVEALADCLSMADISALVDVISGPQQAAAFHVFCDKVLNAPTVFTAKGPSQSIPDPRYPHSWLSAPECLTGDGQRTILFRAERFRHTNASLFFLLASYFGIRIYQPLPDDFVYRDVEFSSTPGYDQPAHHHGLVHNDRAPRSTYAITLKKNIYATAPFHRRFCDCVDLRIEILRKEGATYEILEVSFEFDSLFTCSWYGAFTLLFDV
jgi:hypothetical protein